MAQLKEQSPRKEARGGRTVRATSCGGILLRDNDGTTEICLGRRKRVMGRKGTTWALPKGTPNNGESTDETALREVAEETGLEVRIVAPVGAIDYFFTQDGQRIHKTVHYFLMEPVGGSLDGHDHEFDEVRWMSIDEARRLMSFQTERQIVEEALPMVAP
ncbi:MAG: NUDIX hydrolase [Chloroflexota bacterium]|nr:NUDIX hydrolase [Chloroflexota bacterium]